MFTITNNIDSIRNILYVLEIDLDDKKVIKIGVTSRKIEDRVCEIVTSIFKTYRYFPKVYPKRFRKVEDNLDKEQFLLKYLEEYKYASDNSFGGHTELVMMDLDLVADLYDRLERGEDINADGEVCEECGKIKKFEKEGRACCGHGH